MFCKEGCVGLCWGRCPISQPKSQKRLFTPASRLAISLPSPQQLQHNSRQGRGGCHTISSLMIRQMAMAMPSDNGRPDDRQGSQRVFNGPARIMSCPASTGRAHPGPHVASSSMQVLKSDRSPRVNVTMRGARDAELRIASHKDPTRRLTHEELVEGRIGDLCLVWRGPRHATPSIDHNEVAWMQCRRRARDLETHRQLSAGCCLKLAVQTKTTGDGRPDSPWNTNDVKVELDQWIGIKLAGDMTLLVQAGGVLDRLQNPYVHIGGSELIQESSLLTS